MKKQLLFFLAIMSIFTLSAQEAVPAAGGDASGIGGSASYTIGQVVYTTIFSETGSVAQGVQHAYQVEVTTGISETGIQLQATVYPNPTMDVLHLTIENIDAHNFKYQLYNIQGKLMTKNKITNNQTQISMQEFAAATYLLSVSNGRDEVKTFKIVKTK